MKAISRVLFFVLVSLALLRLASPSSGQDGALVKPTGTIPFSPYRWTKGECTTYQLSYSSSSSSDFGVLFGDIKSPGSTVRETPSGLAFSFETTVKGELSRTILGRKGNHYLVAYRMRNLLVTLFANNYDDTKQAETVRGELEREVFCLMSPEGKILSLLFEPSTGDLAQSYARAILAMTQFVFPEGRVSEEAQWEVQEEDPSGQYIANYRRCSDEDAKPERTSMTSFCKKKTRYLEYELRPKTGPIEVPKVVLPEGELIARFDFSKGTLASMEGAESQTILINNKNVGRVTNRLSMASVRKEVLKASKVASLKNLFSTREKTVPAVSLYVRPSPEKAEASIHRRELGEATLQSLLAELQKAESGAEAAYDATALYLKFKSLIYLHPEACETLARVLIRASPKSLAMSILPKALSTIGHPRAQAALVEAIKAHSKDRMALFALINPLATVVEPTEQAEEALRSLAFESRDPEVSAMAQLALGAQARRIAAFSPERAGKIVDRFIDELKRSSSPPVTKQLLLALGNAGSSRALPEISQWLIRPEADLRATALHALRFIDSAEAEALLIKALSSDENIPVRLAAANALGFRQMTEASFKAQKQVFLKDPDATVRVKVLENLWKAHRAFPEVRDLVKKASQDSSEDVREAAKSIIRQYPESYFK